MLTAMRGREGCVAVELLLAAIYRAPAIKAIIHTSAVSWLLVLLVLSCAGWLG